MTLRTDDVSAVLRSAGAWFPRGATLPEAQWRVRHRAVTWLLVFHAAAFAVTSLAKGLPITDTLLNAAVPSLGAWAASRGSLSRSARSCIAAISLMLSSAVVVHLMNGSIEGHFHF